MDNSQRGVEQVVTLEVYKEFKHGYTLDWIKERDFVKSLSIAVSFVRGRDN